MKKKILIILGTRPEAIKFAPLYIALKESNDFEVILCSTGQHKELLDDTLQFFEMTPDYTLNLMVPNQTLSGLSARAIEGIQDVADRVKPDLIFVQGDTTTAFTGALVAFYNKIKTAHLEAGLRSNNIFSPFPEEVNRLCISKIADFHFAPTQKSYDVLVTEKTRGEIYNVGNTVVDALLYTVDKLKHADNGVPSSHRNIDLSKRIVLVTSHRRENFGAPLEGLCDVLLELIKKYPDLQIVFSVHPNPNVKRVVQQKLADAERICLTDPLNYLELIWIMEKSYLIITDSGGIQEEAPALGKPVLVFRNETERMEGIEAGTAILVGTEKDALRKHAFSLLDDNEKYQTFSKLSSPYGDGNSSVRIMQILKEAVIKGDL